MKSTLQKELWSKDFGMESASKSHELEIAEARIMARALARSMGEITIDDVREAMPEMEWGNWSGSVFKSKEWVCTGFQQARHKNSHARVIRKWTLRDNTKINSN